MMQLKLIVLAVRYACYEIGQEWRVKNNQVTVNDLQ